MKQALRDAWQQFLQMSSVTDELTARRLLMFSGVCLVCLGTTMIGSASMPFAAHTFDQPLYFIIRP